MGINLSINSEYRSLKCINKEIINHINHLIYKSFDCTPFSLTFSRRTWLTNQSNRLTFSKAQDRDVNRYHHLVVTFEALYVCICIYKKIEIYKITAWSRIAAISSSRDSMTAWYIYHARLYLEALISRSHTSAKIVAKQQTYEEDSSTHEYIRDIAWRTQQHGRNYRRHSKNKSCFSIIASSSVCRVAKRTYRFVRSLVYSGWSQMSNPLIKTNV